MPTMEIKKIQSKKEDEEERGASADLRDKVRTAEERSNVITWGHVVCKADDWQ